MSPVIPADDAGIARAVAALEHGEVVAFPTETVYGLGAAAHDPRAVRRIFALKGRPSDHPLIVHLPAGADLARWANPVPDVARTVADAFWPGPLTLILQRTDAVPDAVTGGQETVALRVPDHPVAATLLSAFGDGIAAPSANRFGHVSPTRADHVVREFDDPDLLILEGGASRIGLESTILDVTGPMPTILRPGAVTRTMLEAHLGRPVADAGPRADTPRTSGRHDSHYAPHAPTRLVPGSELRTADCVASGSALLLREAEPPVGETVTTFRLPRDAAAYAHGLYAALRSLDAHHPTEIVIERPPDDADWIAILDRLTRASHPTGPARAPRRSEPPNVTSEEVKEEP